ncbi:hypothetical protein SLEP1_g57092 [Rubroshorea leprosula]|uniref:Uncharacterized protein n=1 Tax=Rubroshorea leprosula TaxID=152421 RepID=A0AAV5MLE6_9ROSI|nr:hypothetical protein SLEP1_g45851 [Rubroshorea leprosula]GKV50385.1 hypothetical protein SLEP1_g57092 [Rubroshorea leprosula]
MAQSITFITASLVIFLFPCSFSVKTIPASDLDLIEFPLNLEYLEAEFFLYGSLGHGLDTVAPNLTMGGPPPIGARRANLDPLIRDVIIQFGLQEVGHLRYCLLSPTILFQFKIPEFLLHMIMLG